MASEQFRSRKTHLSDEATGENLHEFRRSESVHFSYQLIGKGQSLVILDAGYRGSAVDWDTVSRQVTSFARVLVIDRTQLSGKSRSTPKVTIRDAAEDIEDLVADAGASEPLVLAGWGSGALVLQALASRNVDRISGMVLIDPSPRALLDPSTRHRLVALRQNEHPHPVLRDELCVYGADHHAESQIFALPDILELPVTVIMPGIPPESDDVLGLHWLDLQQSEVRRFHQVREIIAGRSRTAIPRERPDVVVDAIQHYCLLDG